MVVPLVVVTFALGGAFFLDVVYLSCPPIFDQDALPVLLRAVPLPDLRVQLCDLCLHVRQVDGGGLRRALITRQGPRHP